MNPQNLQNKPLTKEEIEARIRKSTQVEVRFIDKGNTLAAADVTLFLTMATGPLTIKGFLIFNSTKINSILGEKINITPPSKQVYGKYRPLVFFGKTEFWNLLQKIIFDKYISAKGEQLKRQLA